VTWSTTPDKTPGRRHDEGHNAVVGHSRELKRELMVSNHEHLLLLGAEDGRWFGGFDDEFGQLGLSVPNLVDTIISNRMLTDSLARNTAGVKAQVLCPWAFSGTARGWPSDLLVDGQWNCQMLDG
jgi:hypothetical protein